MYIDLLHSNSSSNDNGPYWAPPGQVAEERLLVEHGHKIVRATHYPRQLRDIDPTITLLSKSVINATSYFTVHLEDRVIYSESTTLEQVESATSNVDGILYKTSLVPGLWDTITRSSGMSIEPSANVYHLKICGHRCLAIYHQPTCGSRPLEFFPFWQNNLLCNIQVCVPNIHTN